jgi:hypothetical protein
VPPGANWSLPAYDLALMTAWDARDMGQDDVEITVYTHEPAPLGLYGAEASAVLRADLEAAGVRDVTPTARSPARPPGRIAGRCPAPLLATARPRQAAVAKSAADGASAPRGTAITGQCAPRTTPPLTPPASTERSGP